MDLPVIQPCNRCGECCRVGGDCVARQMAGYPAAFQGRCEVLEDLPDGTTKCRMLEAAFKSDGPARIWAGLYVPGDCDFPDLRKEICATVYA